MTPDQLQSVIEEIAEWPLEDRRAYLANLEVHSADEARQLKDGLVRAWEAKKK
jgi:hypothetical protein